MSEEKSDTHIPSGGRGVSKKTRVTSAVRAKLILSPARIEKRLRVRRTSARLSASAPVFLAGAIENVVRDIVQGAIDNVKKRKRARIVPKDLARSIDGDKELSAIFPDTTVAGGGIRDGAIVHALKPRSKVPKSDKAVRKGSSKAKKAQALSAAPEGPGKK
jgi:histone H3/H4